MVPPNVKFECNIGQDITGRGILHLPDNWESRADGPLVATDDDKRGGLQEISLTCGDKKYALEKGTGEGGTPTLRIQEIGFEFNPAASTFVLIDKEGKFNPFESQAKYDEAKAVKMTADGGYWAKFKLGLGYLKFNDDTTPQMPTALPSGHGYSNITLQQPEKPSYDSFGFGVSAAFYPPLMEGGKMPWYANIPLYLELGLDLAKGEAPGADKTGFANTGGTYLHLDGGLSLGLSLYRIYRIIHYGVTHRLPSAEGSWTLDASAQIMLLGFHHFDIDSNITGLAPATHDKGTRFLHPGNAQVVKAGLDLRLGNKYFGLGLDYTFARYDDLPGVRGTQTGHGVLVTLNSYIPQIEETTVLPDHPEDQAHQMVHPVAPPPPPPAPRKAMRVSGVDIEPPEPPQLTLQGSVYFKQGKAVLTDEGRLAITEWLEQWQAYEAKLKGMDLAPTDKFMLIEGFTNRNPDWRDKYRTNPKYAGCLDVKGGLDAAGCTLPQAEKDRLKELDRISDERNLKLSRDRAQAVKDFIVQRMKKLGVSKFPSLSPANIASAGYGRDWDHLVKIGGVENKAASRRILTRVFTNRDEFAAARGAAAAAVKAVDPKGDPAKIEQLTKALKPGEKYVSNYIGDVFVTTSGDHNTINIVLDVPYGDSLTYTSTPVSTAIRGLFAKKAIKDIASGLSPNTTIRFIIRPKTKAADVDRDEIIDMRQDYFRDRLFSFATKPIDGSIGYFSVPFGTSNADVEKTFGDTLSAQDVAPSFAPPAPADVQKVTGAPMALTNGNRVYIIDATFASKDVDPKTKSLLWGVIRDIKPAAGESMYIVYNGTDIPTAQVVSRFISSWVRGVAYKFGLVDNIEDAEEAVRALKPAIYIVVGPGLDKLDKGGLSNLRTEVITTAAKGNK